MLEMPQGSQPPSEDELIEEFSGALKDLIKTDVDGDVDPEKIHQYLQARKAELYYDGKQYIALDLRADDTLDYTAVGSPISHLGADSETDPDSIYQYQINVVKGDGKKYVALLGNRAPNPQGVANNQDDEQAREIATRATSVARLLHSWWNIRDAFRKLVAKFWKSGTAFLYTPWVTDGYRYGTRQEPMFEEVSQPGAPEGFLCPNCEQVTPGGPDGLPPVCVGCGQQLSALDFQAGQTINSPQQTGTQTYDNGRAELHLFSVLETTVPFHSRDLSMVPWLRLTYEEHRGRLAKAYPKHRDKIIKATPEGGTSDQTTGRQARLSVSSPTGMPGRRKNLITYSRYWLRPDMYELVTDDEKRTRMQTFFPRGLKLTKIGDDIVELRDERLDDVWAIGQPDVSDWIYVDPASGDHIDAQDVINALTSIGVETLERMVPWFLADPEVVDFQQIRDRARRPMECVPTKPAASRDLHKAIKEAPMAKMSEQLVPFRQDLLAAVRDISGVHPQIWGGEGSPGEMTAREYEGRRNAALMQLSTPWDGLRNALAKATENAARQLAIHGPEVVEVPTESGGQELIEMADLEKDNWHYEIEETLPVTPGQMTDRLLFLMEKGPMLIDMLNLSHPRNQKTVRDLLGFPGLYNPRAEEVEAVEEIIRQLLQGAPTQVPAPDGSIIEEPSIAPKWADNSELIVAVIKAWCFTKAGRRAEQENPAGWANVVAYGMAHERRLQEMMMAQQPPPGGPPPGPEAQGLSPQPFEPAPPQPTEPLGP